MTDVQQAVKDLWAWAQGRGMSADTWHGACIALGFIRGTGELSLEEYVALKTEILTLLGVKDGEQSV